MPIVLFTAIHSVEMENSNKVKFGKSSAGSVMDYISILYI